MNQPNYMSKASSDLILTKELERLREENAELRLALSRDNELRLLQKLDTQLDRMEVKLYNIWNRLV